MTSVMTSQIFATGTKFVVTEETTDGTFGPGTTGFISYVKGRDQDFGNVFYYRAVVIKRGKTGKERLDIADISTPVFELDKDVIGKIMPDEKRRYYVHLKPKSMPRNVLDMPPMDFLGYSLAYSRWIRKLTTRSKHVNAWPNNTDDILNTYVRMDDYFEEDSEYALDRFCREDRRVEFVRKIRIMESTLVKCSLSYMHIVAGIETWALNELAKPAIELKDKDAWKNAMKSYSNKVSSLEALTKAHSNKTVLTKSAMDKVAAGVSWS
jgi:hypothetical protein